MRDVLSARGYTCKRADEIESSGAITRDIVKRLASVDLVIADLTDLNPNVYYELGVRHALRGSGTMLILDQLRTAEIPFDLSAYRVIKFDGTLEGITQLEQKLADALDEENDFGPDSDNPVHDWIPELPENALAAADGSEVGALRRQLKQEEDTVARYRDRFGALDVSADADESRPLNIVMKAVGAAREGNTPAQLIADAEQAVQARDVNKFLSVVRRVLESEVKVEKSEALTLAFGADRLGLEPVGRAVLQYVADYLDDDALQQAILAKLAHSSNPDERALAVERLGRRVELEKDGGGRIALPESLTKMQMIDLALLLDALDRDGSSKEAFAIAYAWASTSPNSSFVLRHLARCYAALGKRDISLQVYRAALAAPDLDDTTLRWLGSAYHNSDETLNALEAYAFAARQDPDDSALFAHAADELSSALRDQILGRTAADNRELPQEITPKDFETCVFATLSCGAIDQESLKRIEASARRLDTRPVEIADETRMDLLSRYEFAAFLFERLASEATSLLTEIPGGGWPDLCASPE